MQSIAAQLGQRSVLPLRNAFALSQTRSFRIVRRRQLPRVQPLVPSDEMLSGPVDSLDMSAVAAVRPVNPFLVFRERMRGVRRQCERETLRRRKEDRLRMSSEEVDAAAERRRLLDSIRGYRARRRVAAVAGFGELYKAAKQVQDVLDSTNSTNSTPTALHVDRKALKARDQRRRKRFLRFKRASHEKTFSALLSVRNKSLADPAHFLTYDNAEQVAAQVYSSASLFKDIPTTETAKAKRAAYLQDFARGTIHGGPSPDHVRMLKRAQRKAAK